MEKRIMSVSLKQIKRLLELETAKNYRLQANNLEIIPPKIIEEDKLRTTYATDSTTGTLRPIDF